ncbi:MAG: hypothetical protein EPO26_04245 [Chloroflexota bacterium]|nr:MAG: hypothetical protein EPO26_04245 [Chloroflexota bacterium]
MAATKVTLTLPSEVLAVVDRFVGEHPGQTRSGVCLSALQEWLRSVQDEEIRHYYETLSDEERREDRDWATLSSVSAGQTWRR